MTSFTKIGCVRMIARFARRRRTVMTRDAIVRDLRMIHRRP